MLLARRGRPKKNDPKNFYLKFRVTKEELDKMDDACKFKGGISRSELVRRALKTYYEVMRYID